MEEGGSLHAAAKQHCRERGCGLTSLLLMQRAATGRWGLPLLLCGAGTPLWPRPGAEQTPLQLRPRPRWPRAGAPKGECDVEEGGGRTGTLLLTAFLFNPLAVFKFSNWNLILVQCINPLNTNLLDLT